MSLAKPVRRRFGLLQDVGPPVPSVLAVNGDGHPVRADSQEDRLVFFERCAWSMVWLGVLIGACDLWGSWTPWPTVDVLAPALVAVALGGFVICWCTSSPRTWWHQGLALVSGWTAAHHRQVVIGPDATATVTLYPPSAMYLPPWASDYVVQAYTTHPDWLSTSKDIWHNYVPKDGRNRP